MSGVHFKTKNELFVARRDGGELRDITNQNTLRIIRKIPSPVVSSALSSEQNLVTLGTQDGTTHVFGLELPSMESAFFAYKSDKPAVSLPGGPICTVCQKSSFVYAGLNDGSLAIFDPRQTTLKGVCKIGNAPVRTICLSRDQQTLYCGINSKPTGEIRSYPVSDIQILIGMSHSKTYDDRNLRSLPTPNTQAMKLDEEERFLYLGLRNGTISKVDTKQWKVVNQWDAHTGGTFALECVADKIISAGTDGMICVWNQQSGELLKKWKAHKVRIHDLLYHPELKQLYSVSHDETVAIWDLSGRLIRRMPGHYANVLSVAISPSGASLATGADDGSIFIWDALTGDLQLEIKAHRSAVRSLLFAKQKLISASRDGSIKVWSPLLEGSIDK